MTVHTAVLIELAGDICPFCHKVILWLKCPSCDGIGYLSTGAPCTDCLTYGEIGVCECIMGTDDGPIWLAPGTNPSQ